MNSLETLIVLSCMHGRDLCVSFGLQATTPQNWVEDHSFLPEALPGRFSGCLSTQQT